MTAKECEDKLKKLGVLDKFVKNLKEDGLTIEFHNKFFDSLNSLYPTFSDYVDEAFFWASTPEGWDFWNEISKK